MTPRRTQPAKGSRCRQFGPQVISFFLLLQALTASNHWKTNHQVTILIAMLASTLFFMLQAQSISLSLDLEGSTVTKHSSASSLVADGKGEICCTKYSTSGRRGQSTTIPDTIAMVAHTLFFILLQTQTVSNHWKNSQVASPFWIISFAMVAPFLFFILLQAQVTTRRRKRRSRARNEVVDHNHPRYNSRT